MKTRAEKNRYKLKKYQQEIDLVYLNLIAIYMHSWLMIKRSNISKFSICWAKNKESKFKNKEHAEMIAKDIAKKTISLGIKDVSFDRGKYKYHGLIKILAESARNEGLNF